MAGGMSLQRVRRRSGEARAVTGRNFRALGYKHWIGFAAGFLEPLLYLFAFHVGVARLVGDLTLPDGRSVPYAVFVAPGMLGASVMNGVLVESNFNFYRKMRVTRLYDSVLSTSMDPMSLALGELYWAVIRGSIYSMAFLVIMVGMDYTTAGLALLAFPASLLIAFSFGAIGLALSTLVRSWRNFEIIATAQFALFLFSGTFVPVEAYPAFWRSLAQLSPLYHAVGLLRSITTAAFGLHTALNVVVLIGALVVGLRLTSTRLTRVLRR